MNTTTTATYLAALAHVTKYSEHYFTCTEVDWGGSDSASLGCHSAVEATLLSHSLSAAVTETLLDFGMGRDGVDAVCIGARDHCGYILMHYTEDGEVVRFVAIRED